MLHAGRARPDLAETDQRVPVDHCVTIGLATAAARYAKAQGFATDQLIYP